MDVLFISNSGAGFADEVECEKGTTVGDFFKDMMKKGDKPENYLIRVNRQIVTESQVLQEGDRITVTPTKIEGGN